MGFSMARHILLSTGDLILRPDHHQSPDASPARRYYEILMIIRTELLNSDGIEKDAGDPS